MDEYEKCTGDKIGAVINEEIYDKEDIEDLKSKAKDSGIPFKEI